MRGDFDDMELDDFDDEDVRGGEIRARVRRAARGPATEGGGLELVGGVLFLVGCLPAAAVAKALQSGTDLTSQGLGGTAALAAGVAGWVGAWPALMMAGSLAVIGALMVVGTIRNEPLRFVAGALVAGLGTAAIFSAFEPGAGGRLGDGTGGALASGLGTLAGAALGLAVIGASLWLALKSGGAGSDGAGSAATIDDELEPLDDVEHASLPGRLSRGLAATSSKLKSRLEKRAPDDGPKLGDRARRQRKIQSKPTRHRSAPATLGDALARGGGEGVSHDEAAALAPDDNTLAYMEDVWRRATASYQQAEPIPPSPYPDDVRLQGQIPPGTQPLSPSKHGEAANPNAASTSQGAQTPLAPTPGSTPVTSLPVESLTGSPAPPAEVEASEIAPFDFSDELSIPVPIETPADAGSRADDPFGAPPQTAESLSTDEADALRSAVAREGASLTGPSDLPTGVAPLERKSRAEEETPTKAVAAQSVPEPPIQESVEPPQDASAAPEPRADHGDPVLEDPTIERPDSTASTLQAVQAGAMPTQPTAPPVPSWEQSSAELDTEPDEAHEIEVAEVAEVAEVDEDGHWSRRDEESPADSEDAEDVEEIDAEAEAGLDDDADSEEEGDDEVEDAELEDEEEFEYEYVDEDGNPIDPADLDEDEYELVDVDGDDGEDLDDDDEVEEEEEADDEDLEPEADDESTVVLEPHARPSAESDAPPAEISTDGERLLEAGRVVVREGRVAVSLLQREFDCDFDEACTILDELQGEGLIGPYKGGKARDILLSAEEWEGRFAHS